MRSHPTGLSYEQAGDPSGVADYAEIQRETALCQRRMGGASAARIATSVTRISLAYVTERHMALDHDHCFLCGALLTDETRTEEHVFPQPLERLFQRSPTGVGASDAPEGELSLPVRRRDEDAEGIRLGLCTSNGQPTSCNRVRRT